MLYGTSEYGGAYDQGTVFAMTLSGTETLLHSFESGGPAYDGYDPTTGLTDLNGILYGTTGEGGLHSAGVVYTVTFSGTESVLHSFAAQDGYPSSALLAVNGELVGTTSSLGTGPDYGGVYAIAPSGSERSLYQFAGAPDGVDPQGTPVRLGEALFGVTERGGTNNAGAIYSISP